MKKERKTEQTLFGPETVVAIPRKKRSDPSQEELFRPNKFKTDANSKHWRRPVTVEEKPAEQSPLF